MVAIGAERSPHRPIGWPGRLSYRGRQLAERLTPRMRNYKFDLRNVRSIVQFLTGASLRLAGAEPKFLNSVVVGLIGAGFVLGTFYPGYMPYDAAFQYWQARTGDLSTQHPPLMALTWMLTDLLIPLFRPHGQNRMESGLHSGRRLVALSSVAASASFERCRSPDRISAGNRLPSALQTYPPPVVASWHPQLYTLRFPSSAQRFSRSATVVLGWCGRYR